MERKSGLHFAQVGLLPICRRMPSAYRPPATSRCTDAERNTQYPSHRQAHLRLVKSAILQMLQTNLVADQVPAGSKLAKNNSLKVKKNGPTSSTQSRKESPTCL